MVTLLSVKTVILAQKNENRAIPETCGVCDHVQWTNKNLTLSSCPYVDKFSLSEDILVCICVYEKQFNLIIDICRLNGHKATF